MSGGSQIVAMVAKRTGDGFGQIWWDVIVQLSDGQVFKTGYYERHEPTPESYYGRHEPTLESICFRIAWGIGEWTKVAEVPAT